MSKKENAFQASRGRNREEFEKLRYSILEQTKDLCMSAHKDFVPLPILHNDEVLYLQFWGWSLNLYPDGTYMVEDTEGG